MYLVGFSIIVSALLISIKILPEKKQIWQFAIHNEGKVIFNKLQEVY
jgi:hypothetical protein